MMDQKEREPAAAWQLEIEMMKYYQDEFKYRNSHFWSLLSKLFVLYAVITLFPICSEIMGIQIKELPEWSGMILPCVGIGVATFSYIVLRNEAKKISEINNVKYKINETLPKQFRYHDYAEGMTETKNKFINKIIIWLFLFQLILSVIVVHAV